MIKTSDFKYDLPDELIADRPLKERDQSRLLHLNRENESVEHNKFYELVDFLKEGDRVVFNNTKVIPGRIFVLKENGVRIELLFVKEIDPHHWSVIAKPARRLKVGVTVKLEKEPETEFFVEGSRDDGTRILFCKEPITPVLERLGEMPIPPYMERRADKADRTTYQTVYAKEKGAVAAPTAGLHFTDDLLEKIRAKGVAISFITLHVGIGTFRPVKVENPLDHPMHSEEYEISPETATEITETKKSGGRVIAVGTTVVRTLEHCSTESGEVCAGRGATELLIIPGYAFKMVDALITNFHLPESTLMMLVSALYNRDRVMEAYNIAVTEKYRFYSYGDSMFIE